VFQIPDVPAGNYKLTLTVDNRPIPNTCGAGNAIGLGELKFTIPEILGGRSDEPFDLAVVGAKLSDTPRISTTAAELYGFHDWQFLLCCLRSMTVIVINLPDH